MTVAQEDNIWTDPSDGYTIRVVRFPYNVDTEDGGYQMGFSFHTGVLWCGIAGQDNRGKRPKEIHIGPLVKIHTQFTVALLERGFGPNTHYLLGRKHGGFPLRVGSRPAVEALLAELKTQWQEYRRASNPEYRLEGLRAIRRARAAVNRVTTGSRKALDSAIPLASGLLATTQGLLASALSKDLNALVQSMVKGPATIYDKAMDAEYLTTYIGGGNHRIFDGGHTILGAIKAVRDASPDDTIIEEAMGFLEGIFRDMTTPKGLPLANWDKATYDQVAGLLQSNFGIPKDWFYDLNSYDAAELLGGVIGVVATALCWDRADTEDFAKLVGGMGVSAAMSANPLLLIVTIVALAKAFHKAHQTGEYAEFVDGHLKGGIGAGTSLVAASQIGVIGGPAGLALLVGLSAGVLVNMATKKVSVVQIGQFIAESATVAATETKSLANRYVRTAEAGSGNDLG